jgi:chromosome partitioning protein
VKKIIAIFYPKGGVGKTTTTMHIARSLGLMKQVVLTIDLCPCGNLTASLLPSEQKANYKTIINGFRGGSIDNYVYKTIYDNLYIVPSDSKLSDAVFDDGPAKMKNKLKILLEASNLDTYDYILLDGPDESGLLSENLLAVADTVLIPVNGFYCINELSSFYKEIEHIKQGVNTKLDIGHILLTFHDQRTCIRKSVVNINQNYEKRVLDVKIPFDIFLKKASSSNKTIVAYEPECDGIKAYKELVKELLRIWEEHSDKTSKSDEDKKMHINLNSTDLSTLFAVPPRTFGETSGKTIGYSLKGQEKEMITDLMVALETNSPSDAFHWIMKIVIQDCGKFLKEWSDEVQNMAISRRESYTQTKIAVNDEHHKKQLLMKRLFLNPKLFHDDNGALTVTYRLKTYELETFENLMKVLPVKKTPVALRGILNFIIMNYGDLIREKAEENRRKRVDYNPY